MSKSDFTIQQGSGGSGGGLIPSTGLTPYTLQATSSTEVNI